MQSETVPPQRVKEEEERVLVRVEGWGVCFFYLSFISGRITPPRKRRQCALEMVNWVIRFQPSGPRWAGRNLYFSDFISYTSQITSAPSIFKITPKYPF